MRLSRLAIIPMSTVVFPHASPCQLAPATPSAAALVCQQWLMGEPRGRRPAKLSTTAFKLYFSWAVVLQEIDAILF